MTRTCIVQRTETLSVAEVAEVDRADMEPGLEYLDALIDLSADEPLSCPIDDKSPGATPLR